MNFYQANPVERLELASLADTSLVEVSLTLYWPGWVVQYVSMAITRYTRPEIINSDQGYQFTIEEYVRYIKGLGLPQMSLDGKGPCY